MSAGRVTSPVPPEAPPADPDDPVVAAERRWTEEVLRPALAKAPERKDQFTTLGQIPVDRLYTPRSSKGGPERIGAPGQYPYTRGIHPTMYQGRLWSMRMFSGFGTPEDTNRRFRYLLSHGESGLSIAFDDPTLYGIDADDREAIGEVGKCGVNVSSLDDMRRLLRGIPLDRVTTSMTINGPANIVWGMFILAGEASGVAPDQLGGTTQNDILKEYIAQKEFIFPVAPSMRLVTDIIVFCAQHMPRWNPVSVSGYHIREAGSTAAQELAFTLADGFAYVEGAIAAGLDVDDFAPRMSYFFNSHIDFFEEIAKYRAARRIYARRMREKYGARNERSWKLRFHTQTAGCSLTAQQIENNITRTALEALAAVLGGTNSLHTNSMDEVLALPTEKAAQIALRTQQIIAYETGVASVADPLGGSWFIEKLTDEIEAEAERYFSEIEARGGMIAAVEEGYPQREIADASFHYQQQMESKERVVVGINVLEGDASGDEPPVLVIDPRIEAEQIARVRELKGKRDNTAVANRLEELREVARGAENVMPAIMAAVRARATEGEIVAALKDVFGGYRERPVF